MTLYVSAGYQLDGIDIVPDEDTELMQNAAVILSTPQGTTPLDRGFGLPMHHLDANQNVAENQLLADLDMAFPEYEPRLSVDSVSLSGNDNGVSKFVVGVSRSE